MTTIDGILTRYERIDVLVDNAGVSFAKPIAEMTLAEWRRVLSVNLDGVFLGTTLLVTPGSSGKTSMSTRARGYRAHATTQGSSPMASPARGPRRSDAAGGHLVLCEPSSRFCIQIRLAFCSTVSVTLGFCDQGDNSVAIATKSQGKTGFVRKFLSANPQGNVKAVNAAWTAARMQGTIGATLINKMRSEMGLSGNLRAKSAPRTAAKAKSGTKISRTANAKSGTKMSKRTTSPGKTMFVKEFLHDHPQGDVKAVNEAWRVAGFDGTISPTVVKTMRASLGLTGILRASNKKSKTSATGKTPAGRRRKTIAAVSVHQRASHREGAVVLNELEADIDRLIFRAMAIGDLTEFENTLRQARRLLYGALSRG
jgi:hypothetical protein